jgi:hypothetical protein
MAKKFPIPTNEEIWKRFEKGYGFNEQIGLYDQVTVNENFFIGNQWEGVESNGLPTPTFNMFKRVINFQVSTITSDNLVIRAIPMASTSSLTMKELEKVANIVSQQFAAIVKRNRLVAKNREFLRNAAVTGDGCMHFYFDPSIENGQDVKGEIVAEVIDNLRVLFGNPNCRDVQRQPYIMIYRRELVDDVRYKAEQYKEAGLCEIEDIDSIKPDSEKFQNKYDSFTDDKVTVITYYFRNRDTGTIWCIEATEQGILREAYDTEYTMYPLIWINWDYIRDCYHGQAMVTGLLANQKFINKMFALVAISSLTTAFPKVIYDQNRISRWDGGVGTAVGVQGDVNNVAKIIDGASISPQIAQFIEMSFDKTHSLLGASDVAMGDSRPDNTSAIIALQRAANTPMELTKQNDHQCLEDAARIWVDMMAVRYGTRSVEMELDMDEAGEQPLGMELPKQTFIRPFDFSSLKEIQLTIEQEVGASAYWSEMASMQTLDNLLMNKLITPEQYIERLPAGYINKKEELLAELRAASIPQPNTGTNMSIATTSDQMPVEGGSGNGSLQRALNREGA